MPRRAVTEEEREYHHAQERKRAQRDAAALAEHVALSPLVGAIRALEELLDQPPTPSEELFGLLEEELIQLAEALKQQFIARKDANGTPPADAT